MYRRLIVINLLLVLLCQSFGMVSKGANSYHMADETSYDMLHEMLHWMGEPHHHDDEEQLYIQDTSAQSFQHITQDMNVSIMGLPHNTLTFFAFEKPLSPQKLYGSVWLSPYLEGIRRPPKSLI